MITARGISSLGKCRIPASGARSEEVISKIPEIRRTEVPMRRPIKVGVSIAQVLSPSFAPSQKSSKPDEPFTKAVSAVKNKITGIIVLPS